MGEQTDERDEIRQLIELTQLRIDESQRETEARLEFTRVLSEIAERLERLEHLVASLVQDRKLVASLTSGVYDRLDTLLRIIGQDVGKASAIREALNARVLEDAKSGGDAVVRVEAARDATVDVGLKRDRGKL